MKYVKEVTCRFCLRKFEIEVSLTRMSKHGHWKRKCPHCQKRYRVSTPRALQANSL